jgi:thiamine biosynthesis lipoprotein
MGTGCTLTVVIPREKNTTAHEVLAKAEATLRRIEALMSDYRDDSEVGRLKAASAKQRVALSPETLEVLRSARHFAEVSGGAFDVTAAPLFQLWKRCGKLDRLPTKDELATARAASSWNAFTLLEDGAVKSNSPAEVDLGGIAKGYGIDRAVETMKEAGCVGGLVEVGGDLRCFGTKPGGDPWRIAVRSPSGPQYAGVLEIKSAAVCTSGDFLRFVEIKGKRYSHIIDPRSGMPVDNMPSVTVIAPDTTTADGLATAISVLGPKKGLDLAKRFKGAECLLMVRGSDERITLFRTAGFPDIVQVGTEPARFGRPDRTPGAARTQKTEKTP